MKPLVGMVVSNKMQKSVVVAVDRLFHNKLYNRYVKRTSKFMAHDEQNQCNIGDRVSFLFLESIYLYIFHSFPIFICMSVSLFLCVWLYIYIRVDEWFLKYYVFWELAITATFWINGYTGDAWYYYLNVTRVIRILIKSLL